MVKRLRGVRKMKIIKTTATDIFQSVTLTLVGTASFASIIFLGIIVAYWDSTLLVLFGV